MLSITTSIMSLPFGKTAVYQQQPITSLVVYLADIVQPANSYSHYFSLSWNDLRNLRTFGSITRRQYD